MNLQKIKIYPELIRSKQLASMTKGVDFEQKIKQTNDEIRVSKDKIKTLESNLQKKSTTAKAQFEQMLMLDHKYRELKGKYIKGNINSQSPNKSTGKMSHLLV